MIKKCILLAMLLFISLLPIGCFNYKDINRTIFVTTMIIDVDISNNPMLYVETFIASRAETIEIGGEEKTIFSTKAASLFDAARNLSLNSNYKFNYSQCKSIIFTEKAAAYGLDNFLDLFDKGQELSLRSYIFITPESPKDLTRIKPKEEQYIGIFLSELAQNATLSSKGVTLRIDNYLNNRLLGSKVNLVNTITLNKENNKNKLTISGLSIFKDDKLVGNLTLEESMAYNFLNNTFKKGTITTDNPENTGKLASIEILKSKTKSSMNFDKEKIHLSKSINTSGIFVFTEKSIHIEDPNERYVVENSGAEYIKKICEKLFYDYKEKDLDIFNIQREFDIKYPKEKVKDALKITELNLNTDVYIKGTSVTTNFD